MKYNRAADVLPLDLITEIQEYAQGCLIYIPNREGLRRNWGASTQAREIIRERNHQILSDHRSGLSMYKIAQKHHLSESAIRKIVYMK